MMPNLANFVSDSEIANCASLCRQKGYGPHGGHTAVPLAGNARAPAAASSQPTVALRDSDQQKYKKCHFRDGTIPVGRAVLTGIIKRFGWRRKTS
jgi:hypothetical protein